MRDTVNFETPDPEFSRAVFFNRGAVKYCQGAVGNPRIFVPMRSGARHGSQRIMNSFITIQDFQFNVLLQCQESVYLHNLTPIS